MRRTTNKNTGTLKGLLIFGGIASAIGLAVASDRKNQNLENSENLGSLGGVKEYRTVLVFDDRSEYEVGRYSSKEEAVSQASFHRGQPDYWPDDLSDSLLKTATVCVVDDLEEVHYSEPLTKKALSEYPKRKWEVHFDIDGMEGGVVRYRLPQKLSKVEVVFENGEVKDFFMPETWSAAEKKKYLESTAGGRIALSWEKVKSVSQKSFCKGI